MRNTLFVFVLILLVAAPAAAQGACTVPENYLEALDENTDNLLRVNVLVNTGGGPLNNLQTLRVNYRLMMSIRQYHEDARATLPGCAQPVNTAAIDTITATQDVLALLALQKADPANADQYRSDIEQAAAALRGRFSALDRARGLQPLAS